MSYKPSHLLCRSGWKWSSTVFFSTFNLEIMIQWEILSQTFRLTDKWVLNTSTLRTILMYTLLFLSLHPLWNSFLACAHCNRLMCSRNTSIILCVCVPDRQQTTFFFQLQSSDYRHLESARELGGEKSLHVMCSTSANSGVCDRTGKQPRSSCSWFFTATSHNEMVPCI